MTCSSSTQLTSTSSRMLKNDLPLHDPFSSHQPTNDPPLTDDLPEGTFPKVRLPGLIRIRNMRLFTPVNGPTFRLIPPQPLEEAAHDQNEDVARSPWRRSKPR